MRSAVVVWSVLLVGALGVVIALGSRGNNDAFKSAQSHSLTLVSPVVLSGARVAAVVSKAPEPVAAARRTPVVRAGCEPKGKGTLQNPWFCTLHYRSGTVAHYLVEVQPDGSYSGIGTGFINGCCVRVPTQE